jgi:hypothetical protein
MILAMVLAAAALAHTDSATAANTIKQASIAISSVRKMSGIRIATVDIASTIFAAAATQLSTGNYSGAERMADVAIRLAYGAEHGPIEIGARIDSIPFGVTPAPAGVPQSALSSY